MDYKGWTIEKETGTQISYPLPNSRNLKQQIGWNTHRKITGYIARHNEHYPNGKFCDTLREAKAYIDQF